MLYKKVEKERKENLYSNGEKREEHFTAEYVILHRLENSYRISFTSIENNRQQDFGIINKYGTYK